MIYYEREIVCASWYLFKTLADIMNGKDYNSREETMTELSGRRFTKEERSWIMYDWANSIYATNIMAAIFPTIFVAFAGDQGDL